MTIKNLFSVAGLLIITGVLFQCAPKVSKEVSSTEVKEERNTGTTRNEENQNQHAQENISKDNNSDVVNPELVKAQQQERTRILGSGKQILSNKCGQCHKVYKPQDFTRNRWEQVLPSMRLKAKLDEQEYKFLYTYIMENVKG